MPVKEENEIKEAKVTKLERNESEDYTPEKDGQKLQTLKAYNIEFDNGDKGTTRTNKEEPTFKVGDTIYYKTKVLTSDKNPDWSKKIFTRHKPNPKQESIWNDMTFRSRDLYLKSVEIAVRMIELLGKTEEMTSKEAFGKIANKVYETIKQNTEEDNKKERLLYQSFYAVMATGVLPAFNYGGTLDIINQALEVYNKTLKIEG